MNEPKLQRTNDEGWEPVTGWHALKLWVMVVGWALFSCGVLWGVAHIVFGWL